MFKYEVGQKVQTDDGQPAEILDAMESDGGVTYRVTQESSAGFVELWVGGHDLAPADE